MYYIYKLPEEVILIIKKYIPADWVIFVNKKNYILYHHLLCNMVPLYESYVRDTIRRDSDFVFEKILGENFDKWVKPKHYIYKNMVFGNFVHFIMAYCIENNSQKCRELLISFLVKRDLRQNQFKNNIVKYIKWKN